MKNEPKIVKQLKNEEKKGLFSKSAHSTEFDDKNTQDAIKGNEKFLNNILNSINDGISVLDRDLNILRTNNWMEKMYKGKMPLCGKKCYDVYQNRKSPCPFCPSIKAMELKSTQELIVPYPDEKNQKGWLSLSSYPLKDSEGNITGVIEYLKDITKQKKIELALKESEERYRTLFESSPEAILCVNNKGFITSVNSAFETIHGYDKDDIVGKHFTKLKLIEIKDLPKYIKIFKKLIKGQYVEPIYVRTKNPNTGKYHDLEVAFSPIMENDKIVGVQSISRDITEKKEKDKLLIESEERYNSLFNGSLDLVYIYDFKGNFIDANEACFKLLGYSRDDIKKLNFSSFLDKGQLLKALKVVRGVKKKGFQKKSALFKLKCKDGNYVWIETTSSLIYRDGKPYAMQGIARDVTQRLKDEADLKKAHEKLRELNWDLENKVEERTKKINQLLKQKDEFINQLGHDLKNPLSPLVNLLPIIERDESDPKRKEMLQVINRNVGYMKNLVTKTIELARLNSPNMKFTFEETNLSKLIQSILKANNTIFENEKIKIINKVKDDIWVRADNLRLEELFNNLLNNALKYSNDNTSITIDARVKNNIVMVEMKDNGIGMTNDQINHIFDEFYKADESRHFFESSGLGMTICKRIVEIHGGDIWAESEGPGKGSTFYFTLPIVKYIEMIKIK
jgi:PAS domain S-box-containing protein